MSENTFPICPTEIPPMLGRRAKMEQLVAELTKTTPSHRSVVGPRFSGKSVVLKHLAQELRSAESPYCCVIEWDLGHGTPQTDSDFLIQLCSRLSDALNAAGLIDYGNHLKDVSDGHYGEICEVLSCLDGEGKKILMIWDGFDKPICSGKLTRNLWDNLLELCRKPCFRLVTATRRELSDLIRDEESVTSDFWGVFGDIVRVGPFCKEDIDTIIDSLEGYLFQDGAKTELVNWSAGSPTLFLLLLNTVLSQKGPGGVNNQDVNDSAAIVAESVTPYLKDLWGDCSTKAKDLFDDLIQSRSLLVAETAPERRDLTERGFAVISGQRVLIACRFLEKHVSDVGSDSNNMARLFGEEEKYRANIADLLHRRLSQINVVNKQLHRFVEIAIDLLPGDPESALNNLTSIEERALDIVCKREFGDVKRVPQSTVVYWTQPPRDGDRLIADRIPADDWSVPVDRFGQLRILQLLTGSKGGFDSKSLCTSKDAYVLLNAIHSYRNRNQHGDGQELHLGVAVAAMMTCIELLACLDRDTPSQE